MVIENTGLDLVSTYQNIDYSTHPLKSEVECWQGVVANNESLNLVSFLFHLNLPINFL